MDPRERIEDIRVFVSAALDGRQAEMWTALPAFVTSYNATLQTCEVQPSIGIQTIDPLNTDKPMIVNMPKLVDCPVIFPHGGGYTLTFPIQPNDECLVIIASRCIDNWWQQGYTTGVNQTQPPQSDLRMHDLSDGFVLVGPRSVPHVLTGVSTNTVQLRSDDGEAYVEIDGSHNVNLKTTAGKVQVNASSDVDATAGGAVHVTANGGDVTINASGGTTVSVAGNVTLAAGGHVQISSGSGIDLSGPPNSIKANGHILG